MEAQQTCANFGSVHCKIEGCASNWISVSNWYFTLNGYKSVTQDICHRKSPGRALNKYQIISTGTGPKSWITYKSSLSAIGLCVNCIDSWLVSRWCALASIRCNRVILVVCIPCRIAFVKNPDSSPTDQLSGKDWSTCNSHKQIIQNSGYPADLQIDGAPAPMAQQITLWAQLSQLLGPTDPSKNISNFGRNLRKSYSCRSNCHVFGIIGKLF